MDQYPFNKIKIPVCNSVADLKQLISHYPEFKVCVYLAYKDEAGWDKSTSRVYFNQVLERFLYIPLNIEKDDQNALKDFYDFASREPRIVAINQTQPHKDNPVLKEIFAGMDNIPTNIDTLIKDKDDKLVPFSLNGEAFTSWYLSEVGDYAGKHVIVMGVGGAGEPIARKIASLKPQQMTLVDIKDKVKLAVELNAISEVRYLKSLPEDVSSSRGNLVLINCAGKEGALDQAGILNFLIKNTDKSNIFVDIRPQLEIELVAQAKNLKWKAYTGYGMNAHNDYVLLEKIGAKIGAQIISFSTFATLVKKAS